MMGVARSSSNSSGRGSTSDSSLALLCSPIFLATPTSVCFFHQAQAQAPPLPPRLHRHRCRTDSCTATAAAATLRAPLTAVGSNTNASLATVRRFLPSFFLLARLWLVSITVIVSGGSGSTLRLSGSTASSSGPISKNTTILA